MDSINYFIISNEGEACIEHCAHRQLFSAVLCFRKGLKLYLTMKDSKYFMVMCMLMFTAVLLLTLFSLLFVLYKCYYSTSPIIDNLIMIVLTLPPRHFPKNSVKLLS